MDTLVILGDFNEKTGSGSISWILRSRGDYGLGVLSSRDRLNSEYLFKHRPGEKGDRSCFAITLWKSCRYMCQ